MAQRDRDIVKSTRDALTLMSRLIALDEGHVSRRTIARLVASVWSSYRIDNIALTTIDLERTKPLSTVVQRQRLRQARELMHKLGETTPFTPVLLYDHGNRDPWQLLLPPIVETHNETHVVMDGVHRLYVALETLTVSQVLAISNVPEPPPCRPKDWGKLKEVNRQLSSAEMIGAHDPALFRPVAQQLGHLRFRTKPDLDRFLEMWST